MNSIWFAGIILGVVLFKALIRASTATHDMVRGHSPGQNASHLRKPSWAWLLSFSVIVAVALYLVLRNIMPEWWAAYTAFLASAYLFGQAGMSRLWFLAQASLVAIPLLLRSFGAIETSWAVSLSMMAFLYLFSGRVWKALASRG